ncbi:virion structural protein [Kosakonia phage Kc263]|uniref:Uncharacterized protein n=1 Tax=Kosakonia phage Kc263 TaxID=2863194 RepID=A0AAE8BEG3_9CAUD|nr:virion structural protein [Kosakonia phage Kc263]QYN79985.1 hypothetical protein [Kosakonia phage Kc263]
MTASVLDDLKMAEISLAKVADVDKMQQEAKEVLTDFRANLRIKEEVQQALTNLESKADYQITVDHAKKVDNLIAANSDLMVTTNGTVISGNESFGVNITPKEWRAIRAGALREMLGETYKNIKRWANQLADNFHRSWVELMTSTEVLEGRLEVLDASLGVVGRKREGCTKVELNELIARSISKNGRVMTTDVAKGLQSELNYIASCIKLWEMEQTRFKNITIRFFGNDRNEDITMIDRQLPKLFVMKGKVDDDKNMLIARQSQPTLDGFSFRGVALDPKWVKDNIKVPEDNTLYADALSQTGFSLIKTEDSRVGKVAVDILPLSEIFTIRDMVSTIIDRLKSLNFENDPVNFNPDDVKDVLNTLRNGNAGQDRAYQYGLITADYQFDVNAFKTQVSNMLTVLASHLLTMLNLHLECYDVE